MYSQVITLGIAFPIMSLIVKGSHWTLLKELPFWVRDIIIYASGDGPVLFYINECKRGD